MSIYLAEHEGRLVGASLGDHNHPRSEDEFLWKLGKLAGVKARPQMSASETLDAAAEEIREFFLGKRLIFDSPVGLEGTLFQVSVWRALMQVPFGETRSYAELAEASGHPGAFRAVGNANGKNRLPVFIPCHRIVAADGKLGGFTGGLGLKQRLLNHEAAVIGRRPSRLASIQRTAENLAGSQRPARSRAR